MTKNLKLMLVKSHLIVFVAMSLAGCPPKRPNLEIIGITLRDSVPSMKRYKPARADWGPGVVFEGDVEEGEIKDIKIVCRNMFDDLKPTTSDVKYPNFSANSDTDVNASLKFLKKVVKDGNTAKLDLAKINNKKDVSVVWSDVSNEYYAKEDSFLTTGEAVPIPGKCRAAIKALKDQGKYENRVFIILSAVSATKMKYVFNESKIAEMGLDASLKDVLTAKAGVKFNSSSTTDLEVDGEKFYIGYAKPELLIDWIPSNLIGPGLVSVSTTEVDYKLGNL